jgi:hypothetical protein
MGFFDLDKHVEFSLGKPGPRGWTKPHSRKRTGGRLIVVGKSDKPDTMDKGTDAPEPDDHEDRATSVAAPNPTVPGTAHMGSELSADGADTSFTRRSSLVVDTPQPPSRSNASSRRSSDVPLLYRSPRGRGRHRQSQLGMTIFSNSRRGLTFRVRLVHLRTGDKLLGLPRNTRTDVADLHRASVPSQGSAA